MERPLGSFPSGADFQAIVSAMLALKGEQATLEWLKAMKTNATAYKGNSTVMKAVNAGQIDGGVIYHYYPFVDQAKPVRTAVILNCITSKIRIGAFVSISGAGVLASSKHPQQAQKFVQWVTGKAGQDFLRDSNSAFEYAVGVNAASNPKLVPLKDLDPPKVEVSKLNSQKWLS